MANGRQKKRKKVRYSEIRIRLSYKQKRSLLNYCHARQTTPNKLIKKMIRKYISNFADDVPEEYYVTENQLELFNETESGEDDVDFMEEEEFENNEQETWNMEEEVENIEHGTGNREEEVENIEQGTGNREEEVENIEHGTGNREEEEETPNPEDRRSNIESKDESPETPPTLF